MGAPSWPRWLARGFGGGENAAVAAEEIQLGDRFFETAPPHAVWTVEKFLATPSCAIPHVIIGRGGYAPTTKIISTAVLRDTRFFRRDRRQGDTADSGKRRRKQDLPQA
ncbi:MAG: hypothetical protein Tsb0016_01920 [Sphingomonadales bacterium]